LSAKVTATRSSAMLDCQQGYPGSDPCLTWWAKSGSARTALGQVPAPHGPPAEGAIGRAGL